MAGLLDDLIKLALVPALKADGYKKKARTFRCSRDRCVQVVQVQSSQASMRHDVRFTINLGVFFPEVHAIMMPFIQSPLGPDGPSQPQCQLRERLGTLLAGRDHWWNLVDGVPIDPVVEEVATA